MDRDQYFRKLISIPSASLDEKAIASYIKSEMKASGYSIKEDSIGNIICFRGQPERRILLSGHMDTVPPAVGAAMLEDNEKYCTDGTTALGADDKCALAVMLEKAWHHRKDNISFLFTVAEEIGLYGSKHMDAGLLSGLGIESAYVLDAEKHVGAIINEAAGKSRIRVTVRGRSAHAGFNPENGSSAIVIAARIISEMPHGRIDGRTTLNIGSFISEGPTNIVQDRAEFIFEIRCLSDELRHSLIEGIKQMSDKTAESLGGTVSFDEEELYSHFMVPADSPAVAEAADALRKAGIEPVLQSSMGGSDANNLNTMGIETVVISSGYFNAHSRSEYLDKAEFSALAAFADAISDF